MSIDHADPSGPTTFAGRPPASGESLRTLLASARALHGRLAHAPSPDPATSDIVSILTASVIRPLSAAVGKDAEPDRAVIAESHGDHGALDRLADDATALRSAHDGPGALLEAVAALQRAASVGLEHGDAERRRAAFRDALSVLTPAIRIAPRGPLLLTNVSVTNWLGVPLDAAPQSALCRCGRSASKPWCDGSHVDGFDDAKDPARVADQQDTYVGQQVTIFDNRGTCQHSGFCTDRLSSVFRVKTDPFVAPSGGRMDEIIRAVRDCPSGALSYAIDGIEARAGVDYHGKREPSIEVSKDGPYRMTGSVEVFDADGEAVVRNAGASNEHAALCRCGHSQNKPFCSGMHWNIEFRDPAFPPDYTPTMFEWAGGLPALTRMMRLFYEKFVPADDLLAPVFANMAADHPQRVAKWLGEVFCGPPCYSEEFGGYPHMISEHLGKCLTEEMRTRWVSLLLQSAREAGLPNDAEFRSAFQAYIEWGSRLAVENSQTNAHPPQNMPMPRWDWNTSAGAPGSRISALAPANESADVAPVLPGPDEKVAFGKHIKQLFRERDRKSMKFAFDLAAYADVSAHADAILERVRNGTMPCDGAWPQERVDVFARWVAAGKPE